MNVFITGGAGYIGLSLVKSLQQNINVSSIVVFDNFSRENFEIYWGTQKCKKIKIVKGDILDSNLLEISMKNADVVIHLAAFVSFPYNHLQNLQYEQVNCWGTLSVVNAIKKTNTVKKAIYISSASVYGFRENISFDEEPMPDNAYGDSKLKGEKYFALLKDFCSVSILRISNVFGFNKAVRLDNVINAFIFESIVRKKIIIYGTGDQKRSYTELSNVVHTIERHINQLSDLDVESVTDFNASLNELKDWLLTKVEDLEYQYVNQNQVFPSQSFQTLVKEKNNILDSHFYSFNKNIAI